MRTLFAIVKNGRLRIVQQLSNKKRFLMVSLLVISVLVLLTTTSMLADDDGYEGDSEGGAFGGLGEATLPLLAIGFAYVFLRRLHIYTQKYLPKKEYPEIRAFVASAYRKLRKPLFYIHVATLGLATIFGLLHGWSYWNSSAGAFWTGMVAGVSFTVMSLAGLVMWQKYRPFWEIEEARGLIKWIHRQWVLTVIAFIALLLHLAVGD